MPTISFNRVLVALGSCHAVASSWVFTEMRDAILLQDKNIAAFQMDHARTAFVAALHESAFYLEGAVLHRALVSLC